jgi:hypothetical protein
VKAKKRYLIGEIARILSPSPDRVEPACPYFSRCGGASTSTSHTGPAADQGEAVGGDFREDWKDRRASGEGRHPLDPPLQLPRKSRVPRYPGPRRHSPRFHGQFGGRACRNRPVRIVDESINSELATLRQRLARGRSPRGARRYILWSGLPILRAHMSHEDRYGGADRPAAGSFRGTSLTRRPWSIGSSGCAPRRNPTGSWTPAAVPASSLSSSPPM